MMLNIVNPVMKAILRSPLHGLVSSGMMLLSFTGRKSGKQFTTPVSYVYQGDDLLVISLEERKWWRNMQGGAPVKLRLQGEDVAATATAYTDDDTVRETTLYMLERVPAMRRFYGDVELDERGHPVNPADIDKMIEGRVVVRFTDLKPV
jgi:deazaflavin-dependent oxidoreductase (nitroreductase family)